MKIIFLTRSFYPNIGGVETHVLEISKILSKLEHDITVISEDIVDSSLKNDKTEKKFGFDILRINAGKNDRFKKLRIWRSLWEYRSLLKNADVIHCHDVFFWYLPFKFLYPSKPVFTTFHGYETKFPLSKKSIILRKIWEKLSNGNICVGEYLRKWYGTKPDYVIYGGVNGSERGEVRNEKYDDKIIKISLIGRLEKDIGVKKYLDALEILKRKKLNFDFQIIGEGSLKKQAERYGKIYGFVEDVSPFLQTSDIIFASSYLTVLHALIHKKVVIAVYNNPLKEDYLKMSPFAKYIYICKSSQEIADIIDSYKKDSWKSESMVENGYIWAKEQSWSMVCDIYLRLWKS